MLAEGTELISGSSWTSLGVAAAILLVLAATPLAIGLRSARVDSRHVGAVTGIAVGAIVIPFAWVCYLQFFAGPIRALFLGIPGLVLLAVHLWVVGGLNSGGLVSQVIAALIWMAVY